MDLCIILTSDGVAVVRSAALGGGLVDEPVAQIKPGESFGGVPYSVWHAHLDEAVVVDDILRQYAEEGRAHEGPGAR